MNIFYYLLKRKKISSSLVLTSAIFFTCTAQAQTNSRNSRPTLDPINDYTTSYSDDLRYIELNGITPGDEIDQEVSIEVSTKNEDLIESIGADLMDNGKAFINYRLKKGAAGTATIKVLLKDNGPTPSSAVRTFHITVEPLNRELPSPSLIEEKSNELKAIPNPAYLSTRIYFSTPDDEQQLIVDLYTPAGAKVKQLFTGSTLAKKPYYVDVNSKNLASGVYIVRLIGQSHRSNLKLVVAK